MEPHHLPSGMNPGISAAGTSDADLLPGEPAQGALDLALNSGYIVLELGSMVSGAFIFHHQHNLPHLTPPIPVWPSVRHPRCGAEV